LNQLDFNIASQQTNAADAAASCQNTNNTSTAIVLRCHLRLVVGLAEKSDSEDHRPRQLGQLAKAVFGRQ